MNILNLVIKKHYFDEIKNGSKIYEYRQINKYYLSRIENKRFDYVKFTNGYSKTSPSFLIECIKIEKEIITHEFFNGVPTPVYKITLGKLIQEETEHPLI